MTTVGGRPIGSNLEAALRDERMRGAITSVSAHDFASGRMGHFQPVSEGMLRSASMVRGTLPVAPTRESLGSRVEGRGSFASSRFNGQHFYSRNPAPMNRVSSFNAEAGQMRSMVQRGPSAESRAGAYAGNSGFRSNSMTGARTPAPGGQGNANWQRFSTANPSSRWPASVNMGTRGGEVGRGSEMTPQGRTGYTASPQGNPNSWQRFNSQSRAPMAPMGGGAVSHSLESNPGGQVRWNMPAPRSGGSYYGGGSRPPMQLNRPIMRERTPSSSGSHYSGGRSYSAPKGGGGGHGGGGGGHGSKRK
jgi:hypothetical protein